MYNELTIAEVKGRQVLDSRGWPTVEAEVHLACGVMGRAAVPSGASTGIYEACELRDGDESYYGKSVMKAVENINTEIRDKILGEDAGRQWYVDQIMIGLDGTSNKNRLGANAILAVSIAVAKAAAEGYGMPFFKYIGGLKKKKLPIPMMNILNGGKHADNTVDFQEFMIVPIADASFADKLQMCSNIYHRLAVILKNKKLSTGVGDEGGFAPNLQDSGAVLDCICEAVSDAGYSMGKDIAIALDVAASELYDKEIDAYRFPGESEMNGKDVIRNADDMIEYYNALISKYPIISIEDGLDQEDFAGWKKLTETIGDRCMLVGDDLFVTNTKRLEIGIQEKAGNAILIKMNQIGTLSETLSAIEMAKRGGFNIIISHRSGETADTTISDLAVAVNGDYIKTGAPCRSERVEKYNQLLRIDEETECGHVHHEAYKNE